MGRRGRGANPAGDGATGSNSIAASRRCARACCFPTCPPAQSRKGAYRGRLVERGRYRFGPLRLSTRFPFGLFSRTITAGEVETLIVLPRLGRLTEGWAARRLEALPAPIAAAGRPGPRAISTACASGAAATAGG